MLAYIRFHRTHLIAVFFFVFYSSCETPEGDQDVYRGQKLFETWNVELSVDADSAVFDRPINIMAESRPLLNGKGKVGLEVFGGGGAVAIEYPIQDTISGGESIYTSALFQADSVSKQQWTVKLLVERSYGFAGLAVIDSLFVEDSSRYYYWDSEEVRSRYGSIDWGVATTNPALWLEYP